MLARWLIVAAISTLLVLPGCGPPPKKPTPVPPPNQSTPAPKPIEPKPEVVPAKPESTDPKPGDKPATTDPKPDPKPEAKPEEKPETKTVAPGEFKLGDLIKPFTPPTLAELDAKVKWKDMPVLDSLKLLRQRQAGESKLATPAEALLLKNDSPEANDKILSALGRLPEKDSDVNWDATILRHTAGDIKSVNSVLASSVADFDVDGLIGFGLFGFDWQFNRFAAADAVVSWQESEDRMYDKIVMRKDLTWSDGKPITAHDVVFSWKLIMTDSVPVPAQRSGTEKLKWVEAYDDHTLVYFHPEPSAINSWHVSFAIVPKHIFENTVADDPTLTNSPAHVAYENNPVVGGAYKVTSRTRGREVVLERRDDYYMFQGKQVRDKPYFKTVRIKVVLEPAVALLQLMAGDLDEKILNPDEWTAKTDSSQFYERNTKAFGVEWVNFQFNWNLEEPFFRDVRVRRALSLAFDHNSMIKKLRYNLDQPARGIFHPGSPYHPVGKEWLKVDYNKQNRREAERLLDEAGWTDSDGDGIRDKMIDGKKVKFDFSVIVTNRPDRIEICNLLKRNLGQLGISVFVSPLEFTVLQQRMLEHKYQASFGGWGTGAYPDTSENIWYTGKERNYGSYSNPEVDKLFDKALKSLDDKERIEIFRKIHLLIYEDQPYMWLYYQNAYYGFNKKLRGYNFSPRGPYHYGPGFSSMWVPAVP